MCLLVKGGLRHTFPMRMSLGEVHKSSPAPFNGGVKPTKGFKASGHCLKNISDKGSPSTRVISLIVGTSSVAMHSSRRV